MKIPTMGTLLALCASVSLAAPATNLVLRSYDYPPDHWGKGASQAVEFISMGPAKALQDNLARVADRDDKEVRKQLESVGVAFPDGAWVRYLNGLHRIFVLNTPENHEILRLILETGDSSQVALDYAWIELPLADVEAATRAAPGLLLSDGEILALWKSGKGRLANTGRLVTRSGQNAENQGVDEVIYPTDHVDAEADRGSSSNAAPREIRVLIPNSWETREAGAIFNATATVDPSAEYIDVTMAVEISDLARWSSEASPQPGPLFPQPLFHSRNTTTSILLHSGTIAVLGGWPTKDGAALTYLMLRGTVIDAEMKPHHPWEALERMMSRQP
jgi:hypothetical protein